MTDSDYRKLMLAYWRAHRGVHSLLRCPGDGDDTLCPGGCGVNAREDMAAIHDARRGKADDTAVYRVQLLLRFLPEAEAKP